LNIKIKIGKAYALPIFILFNIKLIEYRMYEYAAGINALIIFDKVIEIKVSF